MILIHCKNHLNLIENDILGTPTLRKSSDDCVYTTNRLQKEKSKKKKGIIESNSSV